MDKEKLAYDLAMTYAKCKLNEILVGPPRPENRETDQKLLLYLFFEEAFVSYMNMDDRYFDFSDLTAREATERTEGKAADRISFK